MQEKSHSEEVWLVFNDFTKLYGWEKIKKLSGIWSHSSLFYDWPCVFGVKWVEWVGVGAVSWWERERERETERDF